MAAPPASATALAAALLGRVQAAQQGSGGLPLAIELLDGDAHRVFVFGGPPGASGAPDAVVQMRSSVLLDLVGNRLSGPSAFMRGLITVKTRRGGSSGSGASGSGGAAARLLPEETKHLFQRLRAAWLDLQQETAAASAASTTSAPGGPAPAQVPPPPPGLQRVHWQPDTENCAKCGASFSLLFRRHHCRACGACVCAGCSPHRVAGQRVCTPCAAAAASAGSKERAAPPAGLDTADTRAPLQAFSLQPATAAVSSSSSSSSGAAPLTLVPPPHAPSPPSSASTITSPAAPSGVSSDFDAAASAASFASSTSSAVLGGRLTAMQSELRALQEQVVSAAVARLRSQVAAIVGGVLAVAGGSTAAVWAATTRGEEGGGCSGAGGWLLRGVCLAGLLTLVWPLLAPSSPWGRRARAFLTTAVVLISLRAVRATTAGMRDVESTPVWEATHAALARYVYEQLRDLKAFWLKVGQYLSARADVMPAAYVKELSKLQDATAPSPFADVSAAVCEALGVARLDDVFVSFDATPLASASIAQVHRATLKTPVTVPVPVLQPPGAASSSSSSGNGNAGVSSGSALAWPPRPTLTHVPSSVTEVAVKVQHPGVGPIMRSDLVTLSLITRVVAALEPDFDFRPVIAEWSREAIKELHFGREAALTRYAGDVLAVAGAAARVPGVVDIRSLRSPTDEPPKASDALDTGLASDGVLVLEFVHGPKITDAAALAAAGVDNATLMADVCAAFAVTMLGSGVFSGDPHGGNLLVELPRPSSDGDGAVSPPRPRPVLLDFGLTKVLSPAVRLAFCRMVLGATDLDVGGLLDGFDGIGLVLNREAPAEDLEWVQFTLRDTEPVEAARAKILSQRAVWQERVKKRRAAKQRRPFEAFPPDLLFFLRTGELLHGLGAGLGATFSYGKTMAATAALVLRGTAALGGEAAVTAAVPPSASSSSPSPSLASVFSDVRGLSQASVQTLASVLAAGREAGASPGLPNPPSVLATASSSATTALASPWGGLLPLPPWARAGALMGLGTASAVLDLPLQGAVTSLLRRLWEAGELRGAQVAVYRRGVLVVDAVAGERGVYDPRPVRSDTLFNCFSVTKGVLAALLHKLAEDTLRLAGIEALVPGASPTAPASLASLYALPVTALWPSFVSTAGAGTGSEAGADNDAAALARARAWKAATRIVDVLTHTSGLQHAIPPAVSLKSLPDLEAMVAAMEQALPAHAPGVTAGYHYYTFGWLVAGLVRGMERWRARLASGSSSSASPSQPFSLSRLVHQHIAAPLGVASELQLGLGAIVPPAAEGGVAAVTALTDATSPAGNGGPGALAAGLSSAGAHISTVLAALEADPAAANSDEANRLRAAAALISLLRQLGDRLYLLDPRLHNRAVMRKGVIPASNGHFTARALARFYAAVGGPLHLATAAAAGNSGGSRGGGARTSDAAADTSSLHASPPPSLLSLATLQAATRIHVVEERGSLAIPDAAAEGSGADGGRGAGPASRSTAASPPGAGLGSHPLLSAMFGAATAPAGVASGSEDDDGFGTPAPPPAPPAYRSSWGLGWQVYSPLVTEAASASSSLLPFGHSGFGGSHAWYDPTTDVAVAVTVNQLTASRGATRAVAALLADTLGLVRFHSAV